MWNYYFYGFNLHTVQVKLSDQLTLYFCILESAIEIGCVWGPKLERQNHILQQLQNITHSAKNESAKII